MAIDLNLYKGREQSYIKHLFLTEYLQAAAYKIFQGRSPTFNFVDSFAGPWNVSDNSSFSDSSFDLAIHTLETVRADLGANGIAGLRIRFCFCEKDPKAVLKLREYAASKSSFEIHVFGGEFEQNLEAIEKVIPDGFTFTFIDPKGWDIRSAKVFEFLKRRNGEFFLNFMSDHINRHAEYSKVMESFGRFIADPDWEREFSSLPDEWSNEKRILHLLRRKMKESKTVTFAPDFSILVPRKDRTKMRLILGTNSEKGLEVFRDVQAKVDFEQTKLRRSLKTSGKSQGDMFTAADDAASLQFRDGVGGKANQDLAKHQALRILEERGSVPFREIAVGIMEEVAIRFTQTKDLFVEMRRDGQIRFELPPKKKKPQDETPIFKS